MEQAKAEPTVEKSGPKSNWLVVIGVFGRYIAQTKSTRDEVKELQKSGGILEVDDAFEFTSQLQAGQVQDPQNPTRALLQVSKMNIAYRVDGMLFATRMSLTMQGTLIYWLDDLKETDAKVYKDFIQDALRMADGWHKERVKATTGLEITGQMPRVPAPGGLHPGR